MSVLSIENLKIIQIQGFNNTNLVTHGFCTRVGGVSQGRYRSLNLDANCGDNRENVNRNKQILSHAVNLDPERIFLANQVHGDQVLILDKNPIESYHKYHYLDFDAIITNHTGIAIGVLSADCLPIIMLDPKKKVIGIVHSGWRGTCLRIVTNVVNKLNKEFGVSPRDLLVGIGPSIKTCCYEVDIKVVRSIKSSCSNWKDHVRSLKTNKYSLNLSGINSQQLIDAGVLPVHIFDIEICTACHSNLFFSYRADGSKTGRQLSFIQLRD